VYRVSFDWRRWSVLSPSNIMGRRARPRADDADPAIAAQSARTLSPAACYLLIALVFASHYALTGDFWTAALLAGALASAIGAMAFLEAHRATLAELETSRALQKLVAENATDVVTRHDRRGEIDFASFGAQALLGVSSSLLQQRGLSAVMSAADVVRCQDALGQCIELGTPATLDVEVAGGAAPRWIEFRCKPLAGGEGAVGVMRDVTARRWHAIAMRQAREEAESASRAKSAFIATISHELRTPLNAIIGFSEMLHREFGEHASASRHAEYSRIIHESGEHLMSLVRDLLDLSKIEAGRLTIFAEPFHAPDVIASSIDTLRPAMKAKGITFEVAIADDLGEMSADRRACKQMLMNLLSNACKFTPEGGRIELDARIEGANVLLSVRDNGIGIAPDHVARLGEPFYQVDSAYSRQLEGAGLGLAIVRGLADLHGGRLEIESALGEGSCFTLVLPLDAEPGNESRKPRDEGASHADAPTEEAASPSPIALVA
jgi:cell cycle sensor histidine kinase DivJ